MNPNIVIGLLIFALGWVIFLRERDHQQLVASLRAQVRELQAHNNAKRPGYELLHMIEDLMGEIAVLDTHYEVEGEIINSLRTLASKIHTPTKGTPRQSR